MSEQVVQICVMYGHQSGIIFETILSGFMPSASVVIVAVRQSVACHSIVGYPLVVVAAQRLTVLSCVYVN